MPEPRETSPNMPQDSPDTWVRKNFNWLTLRGFGKSRIASITIAAPFIGYVILYHSKVEPYLGGLGGLLQAEISNSSCGPWITFVAKLHLTYLGLLLLGVGTIVFRVCADQVIQTYAGISDYLEREEQHITARNLRAMFAIVRQQRPQLAEQLIERASWLDRENVNLKTASNQFARNSDTGVTKDLLRSYYNVLNRYTRRVWVYTATIAYAIGFSLLAIPGLFFTGRVLCSMALQG